jgi:Dolichyl-phosphate-mannose-protein mannosyltransferase
MRACSLSFRGVLAVLAATLLGGVLRFRGLSRLELWFDENCTYYISHHFFDWPTVGPDRFLEVAHVPYFFLLSLWTSCVGESVWGLRSFSALVGTLTIALVGLVGARLAGSRVGVTASILAAVHPLHIHYSQEARVYAFWAMMSLGMVYALMVAVRTGRRIWWVLFAVSAWLVVLTHDYGLLLLPATVCAVFVVDDRRRALKQWFVAMAGLGVALVPVLVWFVIPHAARGPKVWLGDVWRESPGLLAVVQSVWVMLPAGGYPEYLGLLAGWEEALRASAGAVVESVVGVGSVLVVVGVVGVCAFVAARGGSRDTAVVRNGGAESGDGCVRVALSLGMMAFGFFLVAMTYSYVAGPAYVAGRYDFVAWPAFVIALAGAIDVAASCVCRTRRGRLVAISAIVVFLSACSLATTFASQRVSLIQGSGAKAALIASRVGDDDLLVSVNQFRWFVAHDLSRRGFSASVVSFPAVHDEQICWRNPAAELSDPAVLSADASTIVDRVRAKLAGGGRAWLIAHGGPETPEFAVDRVLFAKLVGSGVDIRPVDDWSGLAELIAARAGE